MAHYFGVCVFWLGGRAFAVGTLAWVVIVSRAALLMELFLAAETFTRFSLLTPP